jgi:SAM-dependent methyltransferase
MADDIRASYTEGQYLTNTVTWHTEDSPYKADIVRKAIEQTGTSFDSYADIGCGAGLVAELLAAAFPHAQCTGYELSPDVDTFWNERRRLPNLSFSHDNLLESTDHYDLITCLDVFEHVEDYFFFLRALLERGDRFVFNIPLDMNVTKILSPSLKTARRDAGHLHYFNAYTAEQTLVDAGYQIIDATLQAAFLRVPPRNWRQAAVLPFRLASLIFGKRLSSSLFGGMSRLVTASKPNAC